MTLSFAMCLVLTILRIWLLVDALFLNLVTNGGTVRHG